MPEVADKPTKVTNLGNVMYIRHFTLLKLKFSYRTNFKTFINKIAYNVYKACHNKALFK